ncbi:protein FAM183A isoform X1 [Seriola lalandi dorsalis]|uniref:Cilia and flagella associated protein 144 n=1 Tax=Seriola lalandi dorsalis TaxID=1841481 RepID=A0A3B4WDM2_SERLL|nr:protein FAM183A isoform X1 [Seriola lalandi dorsalis]XP_056235606.1 protein FAM183A isoform X1 [Seriola aureovittata]
MAGNEKHDFVHQNAIHVETIRKEQRHQKLHTEFSINPHRKLHVLPDKPLCRKPPEVIAENSDFIEAFHKARQEPTKKYTMPLTESQEIGWMSTPLIPSNRKDERFNFYRFSTDVTKHQESAQRSSN